MVKKDFKQIQKEFYEGHRSEYEQGYLNLENFRNRVESQMGNIKNLGIWVLSLKEVKNRLIFDSIGFKKGDLVLQQIINRDIIGQSPNSVKNSLKKLYASFLRFILPLLEFVDKIKSSRGYSNGFYILTKKQAFLNDSEFRGRFNE